MPHVSKTDIVRRYLWAGHRCDYEYAMKRWHIKQRTYQLIIATLRSEFVIESVVSIVTRTRKGRTVRLRLASHQRPRPPHAVAIQPEQVAA